jgi:hypothetical protein
MGAAIDKIPHQHHSKLPKELSDSEIEKIHEKTKLSPYEISKWYCEFYEFSSGHELNENFFIKYYKEILPYRGKAHDFCHLIFNGTFLNVFLEFFRLKFHIYY